MNNYRLNNKTILLEKHIVEQKVKQSLYFRSDQEQDPYQNETDPQHCMPFRITAPLNDYFFELQYWRYIETDKISFRRH